MKDCAQTKRTLNDNSLHGIVQSPRLVRRLVTPDNPARKAVMRQHMRRFTRLTSGHSKKIDNHVHMVALFRMHYNFARVHQTLRVTPAMEAGISSHAWSIQDIVTLSSRPLAKAS